MNSYSHWKTITRVSLGDRRGRLLCRVMSSPFFSLTFLIYLLSQPLLLYVRLGTERAMSPLVLPRQSYVAWKGAVFVLLQRNLR